jgi:tRNA 2-thiocytidine biosynthesis protein TtcA
MPDVDKVAYWLLKGVSRALREHAMLRDGDRVAVAVSGGKDSLALLRLLDLRRRESVERYTLVAVHILGDANGVRVPAPQPLVEWLQVNQYEYSIEPLLLPEGEPLPLTCARCARNRRRSLFVAARRLGCNVLALGHHADDLAETTLMNLIHHGLVETMAPVRDYFQGAFRLIRPLCYLRESEIRRYARASAFPAPPPLCPLAERTRRRSAAELLRLAKHSSPQAVENLLRAGLKGNAAAAFTNPDSDGIEDA